MQHAEFRRLFGANPTRTEPQVLAHRNDCAECARYAADLERVDQMLASALAVPAPENYRKPWELEKQLAADSTPRRSPLRWYAMAAGLVAVIALAGTGWLHLQRDKLFAELIKHAHGERSVMVASEKRVDEQKVRATLAKAGARLHGELAVSTARTCKVRGVVAPHLFVQTPDGPVQLLLLTEHRFLLTHSAQKQGYRASLVPIGGHSIAVVAASEAAVANGEQLARKYIDWTPDAS